jgi:hypothetical protein
MSRADLDQTVGRLRNAVRGRLANEEIFKNQVYDRINRLLAGLNECAGAISSAPSDDARSSAVGDLSRQIREITNEIGNLQRNPLAEADVNYVTGTLGTEARNDNLKWTSPAEKGAFRPPAYVNGSGASVDPPPPYPGLPSGASPGPSPGASPGPSPGPSTGSSTGSSRSPLGPSPYSLASRGREVVDGRVVRVPRGNSPGSSPASNWLNIFRSSSGGWSPRRKTPRRSPKKKTYRR